MINELLRGLPAGAALGLLIAGGIAYYAGGELGERRALRLHQQSCVATLRQGAGGGGDTPLSRLSMTRGIISRLKQTYGPIWQVMQRSIDIDRLVEQAMTTRRLQLMSKRRDVLTNSVGRCQCAIRIAVRDDSRLAHAVYVASLRTIQPVAVTDLRKGIQGVLHSGRCGKGV